MGLAKGEMSYSQGKILLAMRWGRTYTMSELLTIAGNGQTLKALAGNGLVNHTPAYGEREATYKLTRKGLASLAEAERVTRHGEFNNVGAPL